MKQVQMCTGNDAGGGGCCSYMHCCEVVERDVFLWFKVASLRCCDNFTSGSWIFGPFVYFGLWFLDVFFIFYWFWVVL